MSVRSAARAPRRVEDDRVEARRVGPIARALVAGLAAACLGGSSSCSRPRDAAVEADPARRRSVVDDLGARLELPPRPRRVVSLAPSLTETVFALGAGPALVAVSDSCDWPEEVTALPRVGDLSAPSVEAVLAARPDLILATAQGNPRESVERLRALGAPVFGVRATSTGLAGVSEEIRSVARALGREDAAAPLLADMSARLQAVRGRAASRPRRSGCCLVWTSPLIAAGQGTFLSELLGIAGIDNACGRHQGRDAMVGDYPRLSREDLLLADPDVLLLATGVAGNSPRPLEWGRWAESLRAVRAGRVVELPPLVLRPTLRLADGAEHLERVLADLPLGPSSP